MKSRKRIFLGLLIMVFVFLSAGCGHAAISEYDTSKEQKEAETLLSMIESYRGCSRTVSEEELEFYSYFVKRDLTDSVEADDFEELVQEYANEVNALFYLGNRLGFCEPYSFEQLEHKMEKENLDRKLKLEEGEVVYGLEEFTLEIYFQYLADNLQAAVENYLEANADAEILELAKVYYEQHEEDFRYRKEVVYEQNLEGVSETLTADVDQLSLLGKTDTELADFLQMGEIGDVYEDEQEEGARKVVLKEITYNEDGYENNADMALYRMVRAELYEKVLRIVAENNPVTFETN